MNPEAATIFRRARALDIERAAAADGGGPTPEQMARIQSFARRAMKPGDVYVFPAVVSSTEVDDYYTWMDAGSLGNGAAAANSARGLPLMMLHQLWSDMPVGKWFEGRVERSTAPAAPRPIPLARDALGRLGAEGERRLVESAYMVRGGRTDQLIEDIDAGLLDSVSWGATVNQLRAPGGDFLCDVCDRSLLAPVGTGGCRHWPGMVVEAPGVGRVIATGRYVNAVQVEASLVPQGSNQSALIQRAAAAYRTGDLSPDELDAVEVIYGTRLRPARSYSIPAGGAGTDAAGAPQMTQEGEPMQTGTAPMDVVRAFLGEGLAGKLEAYRSDGRSEWEMAARVLASEQVAIQSAADEVKRQADERDAVMRTGLGLADGEDLATGLARIASEREYGQAARAASLDALCESYVRAHSVADGWDRAAYLARRANWSPADIDAERAELDLVATRTFKAGATADAVINDGSGDAPVPTSGVKRVVPGFTNA